LVKRRAPVRWSVESWFQENASFRYVAPYALFIIFLAVFPRLPIAASVEGPLRVLVLGAVCYVCWPPQIPLAPRYWAASIGIGTAVFVLWIAPDLLIRGYRESPLFSNSIVGRAQSSVPPAQLHNAWFLVWRTARAVVIVPVIEELFWRAWLMRWLINTNFCRVPLGAYSPFAFWLTAILFASEHGPYWDVGLVTGVIYNCWMIRSKSVADCIVMHATTNAILSAYVLTTGQWQYWQ
jgi:uncharacterized protein